MAGKTASKEVEKIDIILFANDFSISYFDRGDTIDGQTPDRTDGAIGICGDHAGSEFGLHSHAGRRNPLIFWSCSDRDRSQHRAVAILFVYEKYEAAKAALRQAGDPDRKRQHSAKKSKKNKGDPG